MPGAPDNPRVSHTFDMLVVILSACFTATAWDPGSRLCCRDGGKVPHVPGRVVKSDCKLQIAKDMAQDELDKICALHKQACDGRACDQDETHSCQPTAAYETCDVVTREHIDMAKCVDEKGMGWRVTMEGPEHKDGKWTCQCDCFEKPAQWEARVPEFYPT